MCKFKSFNSRFKIIKISNEDIRDGIGISDGLRSEQDQSLPEEEQKWKRTQCQEIR